MWENGKIRHQIDKFREFASERGADDDYERFAEKV